MVSITRALRTIKENVAACLAPSFIEQVCREAGYAWRDRVLDPVSTIHLFILQILYANTACSHLPRITGLKFSASAYCQARAHLPLRVITSLVCRVGQILQDTTQGTGLWHGHRTVLLDGSGLSMPDSPLLQRYFGQSGQQKKGCGFPGAHLLAAFDAGTGLIVDLIVSPLRTHDMAHVAEIGRQLRPGDLVLADRGLCSFAHLALIQRGGMEACFRIHQKQIVNFRPHRRSVAEVGRKHGRGRPTSRWLASLGCCDQLVEWTKPPKRPTWMSAAEFAALPASLRVRELRYRVAATGFRTRQITLVTTLLDATRYPAHELAKLYKTRWQVETNLGHLKTTMGLNVLRCRTLEGVLKEVWMFALVYNLVRLVMLEAARRQGVAPGRISFIDALRWLTYASPPCPLPPLIVNPLRPDRVEPRVIKRRMKKYTLMNKPRPELRQRLMASQHAA